MGFELAPAVLKELSADGRLLFVIRALRLFGYGAVGVVLFLYLTSIHISPTDVGALFTFTLLGDAIISIFITTRGDVYGRKRMLMVGSALMMMSGVVFALTRHWWILVVAATVGVISPSGSEIGPFLALEQSVLTQLVRAESRTAIFAWYNLVGTFATSLGMLVGGGCTYLASEHLTASAAYRLAIYAYVVVALLMLLLMTRLSAAIEAASDPNAAQATAAAGGQKGAVGCIYNSIGGFFRLQHSRGVVLKLSLLFTMDSFGGAIVLQSVMVYWFNITYGVSTAKLGALMFGANLLAGISALFAVRLAAKIGLIQTMFYTHVPSNILLGLIPLMPNLGLAMTCLLLRFSISQMDVPTRQSYTMAVVHPSERSAAGGVTNIVRSIGAAISPIIGGVLLSKPETRNYVFYLAAIIKLVYDFLLLISMKGTKPPEEQQKAASSSSMSGAQYAPVGQSDNNNDKDPLMSLGDDGDDDDAVETAQPPRRSNIV